MKTGRILILVGLAVGLFGAVPAASATTPSVAVGIVSVAACKDVTTIAVSGSSTYSNNRLDVGIYHKDSKGKDVLLKQVFTPAFGSGAFMLQVSLPYTQTAAAEGETLRIDVQVQRLSGGSYVNVGPLVMQNATVADKYCFGKCNVVVDTTDKAPAAGTIALRSHFGTWFRPEGRLHGALPVIAGQKAHVVFVGVPCDWPVRAWYYPKIGDKTPKLLPAQYWPHEFQANQLDVSNPYVSAFGRGLKATDPIEADDPLAAR